LSIEVIKAKILRIMIILTTGNDNIVIVHNFFINQFLDSETYTILAKVNNKYLLF